MELIHKLLELVRDPETVMKMQYPLAIATLIIFLETGALVFLLPGDSLLVVLGLYAAKGSFSLVELNALLIPAAIIGDAVSYFIGARTGPAIFNKPESRFFKPQHLKAAHEFYERHGGKAIIIARFMPLVRTFVPVVAGVGQMPYRRFASFNVIGGAAWVLSMTVMGFALGNLVPNIGRHIEKVIIVVVFVSILPGIIAWFKNRKGAAAGSGAASTPAP